MSSIALVMIVKDESGVIERCLSSVRDLISHWTICDTGSSDATPDLIRATLDGIPGAVHHRPWVNFGHNRSESLALARGTADYLLLLDADWTFTAQAGALDELSADVYLVEHKAHGVAEWTLRNRHLVRGDLPWRYEGVTHEFLAGVEEFTEARLDGAHITDWSDGGVGRAKRWHQDAELLVRELRRDPSNLRYRFYLAQTFRDLGQPERAIHHYALRANAGGWAEEVFYSVYQIGVLQRHKGNWEGAARNLETAHRLRPSRIEPLYHLAAGFRERGEHPAALRWAERGLGHPVPDDILFVEPWIYKWGMLFEYAVAAFHTGRHAEAVRASEELLALTDLTPEYRALALDNHRYYTGEARPELSGTIGNKRVTVTLPRPGESPLR
jgi:tetratricopeptide (TPR) repeat protein